MPGCKGVGSVQRAAALSPEKRGFVSGGGTKRGVSPGQLPGQCGGSFGPWVPLPTGQEEGRRRRVSAGQQQQSRFPGKVRASGLCGQVALWAAETSSSHL